MRTLVCLLLVACAQYLDAAETGPARPVVMLTSQEPEEVVTRGPRSLLAREIARQAALIAARDELGCLTRDATLGESAEAADDGQTIVLDASTGQKKLVGVRLKLQRPGAELKSIYDGVIKEKLNPKRVMDYASMVTSAEKLSRTDLADALRKAGLTGSGLKNNPSLEVPATIEKLLSEFNFMAQWTAVRQLHTLQHERGQSANTLAALARGYANLGQLTRANWSPVHHAFNARALLYAERLVQADPKNGWAIAQRAYARGLVGMHVQALEDLEAASKAEPDAKKLPDWLPLIEALCKYDLQAPVSLRAVNDQLARYVAYLQVEYSGCENHLLEAGQAMVEVAPECYLVWDSYARFGGNTKRYTTTDNPAVEFRHYLPKRVRAVDQVPPGVEKSLAALEAAGPYEEPALLEGKVRMAIVEALRAAGPQDTAEPSWQSLARLVEDTYFMHAYRRLEFLARMLNLPRDQYDANYQAALASLVNNYPYKAAFECLVYDPKREPAKIAKIVEGTAVKDAVVATFPLMFQSFTNDPQMAFGKQLRDAIFAHCDDTAYELSEMAPKFLTVSAFTYRLRDVSPYAPHGIANLIIADPKYAATQLDQWEKEFGQHACVIRNLAVYYRDHKDYERSIPLMEKFKVMAPDQWVFEELANQYRYHSKQPEKWLTTLEESFEAPDHQDSHPRHQVMLARYFMGRRDNDNAKKYADLAAASGISWTMTCASEFYELQQDWETAESLQRRNSENNPGQQMEWYFWCRRTGHGDVAPALKLAEGFAETPSARTTTADVEKVGVLYLLAGKKKQARAILAETFRESGNPYAGIHLALLADEDHDPAARDAALKDVAERGPKYLSPAGVSQRLILFAEWLATAYAQPAGAEPDLEGLNEIIRKSSFLGDRANITYFAGRYFHAHQNSDLARLYWQACQSTNQIIKLNYALASAQLRELNEAQGVAE